jgi:hypothetical protein
MSNDPSEIRESVTIVKGDPRVDFWLHGHLTRDPRYTFIAKVFDVGSQFGIDNGRISKLEVHQEGRRILSYERVWDEKPQCTEHEAVLDEIVSAFPNPDQNIGWRRSPRGRGRGF